MYHLKHPNCGRDGKLSSGKPRQEQFGGREVTTFSTQNLDSIAHCYRFRDPSAAWLRDVTNINQHIDQLSSTLTTPVKIAVLDTGCDLEAVFFHSRARRSRIKDWKDWVNNPAAECKDCNGHGTHAVALAIKTAPAADIFIARVARHREELQGVSEVIVNVSASFELLIQS